jgi:BASS family bile acid:Na+ symporter
MTAAQWLILALKASIMLTVFGLGLMATFQNATYLLRRPALLARAFLSMDIVMPGIALLIATTLALPLEVKVALVALALSPVPPILYKKQLTAGGRMDYVVGLLVAMSLLAVVFVPLAVMIVDHVFDREAVLSPASIAKIMVMTVLAPLIVGLVARQLFPTAEKAASAIRMVAGIILVAGVVPFMIKLWPVLKPFLGNGTVLVMVALAIVGLAVGHVLGGPRAADRTALALSTASRHPGVALAVATSGTALDAVEAKPALALILLYLVVATIVCIPYQKWRERSETASDPTK